MFWIALILMLQPFEWINVIGGMMHPVPKLPGQASWAYFDKAAEYVPGRSLINTLIGNSTNGKTAVLLWTWEVGRVFQTMSLFMLGMLAGRKYLFSTSTQSSRFWKRILISATLAFIPLFIIKNGIPAWISVQSVTRPLSTIVSTWSNLAFMLVLVSGFYLLYEKYAGRVLNVFSAFGKMSMSNYIMQSIIGSFIYYGFGLGLYQYTGATYSLLIGLLLAVLQGIFSKWWMKSHRQGPLESIWHKLTWIGSN